MSSFLLPPLRRRIRRRNQKKSVFVVMNACSSDQIGLFRCFIPPFHLLCGGSSSTRTQRSPFRASNPSKICRVHCAGTQDREAFLMHLCNLYAASAFCISRLAAGVGAPGRGSPRDMGAGEPVQAAVPLWWGREPAALLGGPGGWQVAGFTAVSGA